MYWYKFVWKGEVIRESTKQANDKVARQMEAAHKTSLAKGEVGLREKKRVPTLGEFARGQFLGWAESTFAAKKKTWLYYRNGVRRLLEHKPIESAKLNEFADRIAGYVASRQASGLEVSSINRELQVLRRMLHLAVEWGVTEHAANVKMLPGERHRELVLDPKEEARYLAAAPEPLASVATLLADTGMRPEECYRLQWEYVTWVNGRHGSLSLTQKHAGEMRENRLRAGCGRRRRAAGI